MKIESIPMWKSSSSLLTSAYHVSLPIGHRKRLKDQVHTEELTFEYTFKKKQYSNNFHEENLSRKQTIVTSRNTKQHVHRNNLLYD